MITYTRRTLGSVFSIHDRFCATEQSASWIVGILVRSIKHAYCITGFETKICRRRTCVSGGSHVGSTIRQVSPTRGCIAFRSTKQIMPRYVATVLQVAKGTGGRHGCAHGYELGVFPVKKSVSSEHSIGTRRIRRRSQTASVVLRIRIPAISLSHT